MAMTSDKWKGAWGGDTAPGILRGLREGQAIQTAYVDENGQTWYVAAYDPANGRIPFADEKTYKWHATPAEGNIYGEDPSAPSIAGSESEFAAVAAIDVYAASWKRTHIVPEAPKSGGAAVLWLILLVAFAFTDKKRR